MIEDKYYKPVEKRLFERQDYEWDRLCTGRTEVLPSEMKERHGRQFYPYSRTEEQASHEMEGPER